MMTSHKSENNNSYLILLMCDVLYYASRNGIPNSNEKKISSQKQNTQYKKEKNMFFRCRNLIFDVHGVLEYNH